MYRFLFIIMVLLSCKHNLPSQVVSDDHEDMFISSGQIMDFKVDKLEQLYTFDKRGELSKYDPNGELAFSYLDRSLGMIDYLDVTNPLKLMAFYRDYQSIVFLDNTLSVTSRIELSELGYQDISAVGLSNDNNIWLFDNTDSRLKKIDNKGIILIESNVLSPYLDELNPTFLRETNNHLLLNDPEHGVHLFDNFGKYFNTAKFKNLREFQFRQNKLIFAQADRIKTWDVYTYEIGSFSYPEPSLENPKAIHLLDKELLVLNKGNILRIELK